MPEWYQYGYRKPKRQAGQGAVEVKPWNSLRRFGQAKCDARHARQERMKVVIHDENDASSVCRKQWQISSKLDRIAQSFIRINLSLRPGTLRDFAQA
jgi:hypothetical protein